MSAILREESPDPWYTRFWTAAREQEILDYIVTPSIARFVEAGYKTAIVLEKDGKHYLVHCLAVKTQDNTPPQSRQPERQRRRKRQYSHQISAGSRY
ncbi:MAG: hypothetical protein IGS03_00325 [Candidatus Sericytochromatia bacterium]|nr:hypothetical protein [Candidatus Sericytochromatia bacterium]